MPRKANITMPRSLILSAPETAISGQASPPNGRRPCTGCALLTIARLTLWAGLRPWQRARNAAKSLLFWSARRPAGTNGTEETRYEEGRSNAEGATLESDRFGRAHRRDHS